MNKLITTLAVIFMALSPVAIAGPWDNVISGSIGVESDYMFRGEHQSEGSATQMNMHVENSSGLFGGVWVSQVDVQAAEYEHNFYAGYSHKLSDNMSLHGGVVHYDWDINWLKIGPDGYTGLDDKTEVFVGGVYKSITLNYYQDHSNSAVGFGIDDDNLTYLEVSYELPLGWYDINLHMNWGQFNDGDDVLGIKGSKDFGQWALSFTVMEESTSKHSVLKERSSVGIHYNF